MSRVTLPQDPLTPCALASTTHLVLMPSYNPGPGIRTTVAEARAAWNPVWVVVDGSDDASPRLLADMARSDPGLRVIALPRNRGKGAAVLEGVRAAQSQGFTHILTMDSDGQHPAHCIRDFMARSAGEPGCAILGLPQFDAAAPSLRVRGRRISNWWANLETLHAGVGDSLFGFRVYPLAPLLRVMERHRWMRRFDFDPEAIVRLCWAGVRPLNVAAPVRYLRAEEGGVSHFRYVRDNALLSWMHFRLMVEFILRLPLLLRMRSRARREFLHPG
jgi:glycosyltransferase involved in cell wall biosynthesis